MGPLVPDCHSNVDIASLILANCTFIEPSAALDIITTNNEVENVYEACVLKSKRGKRDLLLSSGPCSSLDAAFANLLVKTSRAAFNLSSTSGYGYPRKVVFSKPPTTTASVQRVGITPSIDGENDEDSEAMSVISVESMDVLHQRDRSSDHTSAAVPLRTLTPPPPSPTWTSTAQLPFQLHNPTPPRSLVSSLTVPTPPGAPRRFVVFLTIKFEDSIAEDAKVATKLAEPTLHELAATARSIVEKRLPAHEVTNPFSIAVKSVFLGEEEFDIDLDDEDLSELFCTGSTPPRFTISVTRRRQS